MGTYIPQYEKGTHTSCNSCRSRTVPYAAWGRAGCRLGDAGSEPRRERAEEVRRREFAVWCTDIILCVVQPVHDVSVMFVSVKPENNTCGL